MEPGLVALNDTKDWVLEPRSPHGALSLDCSGKTENIVTT